MIQLSRILCAVDFSRPARAAFARALALSREHNAELTVVQAVPVTESFGLRGRARMTHIAALRHAAEAEGVSLRVSVQHGDPAGVIVLHANARPFDLVIVGTHQRVGMGRLREGSVAERVIQRVTSPVLIVPAVENDGGKVTGTVRPHRLCNRLRISVDSGARHGATDRAEGRWPLDAGSRHQRRVTREYDAVRVALQCARLPSTCCGGCLAAPARGDSSRGATVRQRARSSSYRHAVGRDHPNCG